MFALEDFTKLLNETTELISKEKEHDSEELEEIQFNIEANVQALSIMCTKIEDPEARAKAEAIVKSLNNSTKELFQVELDTIKKRPIKERSELIDKEMLKKSKELKEKVLKFNASLNLDEKIIENLQEKMKKNSSESQKSAKVLETNKPRLKSSNVVVISLVIFILMYFFIRFF